MRTGWRPVLASGEVALNRPRPSASVLEIAADSLPAASPASVANTGPAFPYPGVIAMFTRPVEEWDEGELMLCVYALRRRGLLTQQACARAISDLLDLKFLPIKDDQFVEASAKQMTPDPD